MEPDYLKYLRLLYPKGPWVLSAIWPERGDRKPLFTETFLDTSEELKRLGEWVESWQGKRNIYYSVNPIGKPIHGKARAKREDITSVNYLHVDVDARAGEDLEEEIDRIEQLLQNFDTPPASLVVFSGGGYQALWRLEEPIPLDGTKPTADDAAGYSRTLGLLLGGDHTHNIDRVLRLPGTENVPDQKKKDKGRKQVKAKLAWHSSDQYALTAFKHTSDPQAKEKKAADKKKTTTPDNKKAQGGAPALALVPNDASIVKSLEELDKYKVPNRVKQIIVHGREPDVTKPGDDSRSEWLYDCVCNLVRCGVPPQIIYGIITDSAWEISSSVIDSARGAHEYAVRQIENAQRTVDQDPPKAKVGSGGYSNGGDNTDEDEPDGPLEEINSQYAAILNYGGKFRIILEAMDYEVNRISITPIAPADFIYSYSNIYVEVASATPQGNIAIKNVPAGKWWLSHPQRRQYTQVAFAPRGAPPEVYNLWKGFAVESEQKVLPEDHLFLRHIKENLCKGNQEYYEYLLGWMANTVQNPGYPGQVAIVLQGDRGTGKGVFAKHFGSLFGRHYLPISDPKHLVGNFNSHLRDCVVLFADEAFYANDKKHEGILKMLITEETLMLERKGIDATSGNNCTHLIMASNEDQVVSGGAFERRFFVLRVGNTKRQDGSYFQAISDQMDNGGREALLHFLENYSLEDYNVRSVPKTEYLQEQINQSLATHQSWWLNKLLEGKALDDDLYWPKEIKKADLQQNYYEYCKQQNERYPLGPTVLGTFINKVCPGVVSKQSMRAQTRFYMYRLPTLSECREAWDKIQGVHSWPVIPQEPELEPYDNPQEEGF